MLRPYRRWFPRLLPPLVVEEAADRWIELQRAFVEATEQAIGGAPVSCEMDQSRAEAVLITAEGTAVRFRAVVAGTFRATPAGTWQWGWASPEVDTAVQPDESALRALLADAGGGLAGAELEVSPRDVLALHGAALQASDASGASIAMQGDTAFYVMLFEETERQHEQPVPDAAPPLEVTEPSLPLDIHRQVQALGNQALDALQAQELGKAAALADQSWDVLRVEVGWSDAPPRGWLDQLRAEIAWQQERYADVASILEASLTDVPNLDAVPTLVRIGQAARRAAQRKRATHALVRAHVLAGPQVPGLAPEDQTVLMAGIEAAIALRQSTLRALSSAPGGTTPALVLRGFLTALHEAVPEDAAERQTRWCELVAGWCTPKKRDGADLLGAASPHHPDQERIVAVTSLRADRVVVETTVAATPERPTRAFRYRLVRAREHWWIDDAEEVFASTQTAESFLKGP